MSEVVIELPAKLKRLFSQPRGAVRFRGAYGGRGSAKSVTFAKMAVIFGYAEPLRILCTRELQVSIKESFHAEIKKAIESESWLVDHYEVGENYIRGKNGTEFVFRGLRHNMTAIKSMAQIDICIVEEAEDVPEQSWVELIPTIRAPLSEIWCVWNPRKDGSPIDKRLRKSPPPRSIVEEVSWKDNPWFPSVLDEERKHNHATMDISLYRHIWEGDYLQHTKAQIFADKVIVQDFDRESDVYYQGIDYGFAQDPLVATRCFIRDNNLFISHELAGIEVQIDDHAPLISSEIPGFEKFTARADNARPELTAHLNRKGLPLVKSVAKWPGSILDGIAFIKSFKNIIIHPSCTLAQKEFALYSYKVDRLSGDILPEPLDMNNNSPDAVRYALEPLIRNNGVGFFAKTKGRAERTGGKITGKVRW